MSETTEQPVWVFDDFQPGQQLGSMAIVLDDERLGHWQSIYGAPTHASDVPSGVLVAAMMEAYLKAIQPRPPGNIHASQKVTFFKRVGVGDRVNAEVHCLTKERRKERGWVTFGVTLRVGDHEAVSGEIRTIWAK